MPYFFLVVGLVLVVSASRNTQGTLLTLVEGDFTGPDNFIYWFISIVIIGALGYIKPIQPFSEAFLVLVILSLFLSNGGFFSKFQSAVGTLKSTTPQPVSNTFNSGVVTSQTPAPAQSSGGGILGTIGNIATGLLSFL